MAVPKTKRSNAIVKGKGRTSGKGKAIPPRESTRPEDPLALALEPYSDVGTKRAIESMPELAETVRSRCEAAGVTARGYAILGAITAAFTRVVWNRTYRDEDLCRLLCVASRLHGRERVLAAIVNEWRMGMPTPPDAWDRREDLQLPEASDEDPRIGRHDLAVLAEIVGEMESARVRNKWAPHPENLERNLYALVDEAAAKHQVPSSWIRISPDMEYCASFLALASEDTRRALVRLQGTRGALTTIPTHDTAMRTYSSFTGLGDDHRTVAGGKRFRDRDDGEHEDGELRLEWRGRHGDQITLPFSRPGEVFNAIRLEYGPGALVTLLALMNASFAAGVGRDGAPFWLWIDDLLKLCGDEPGTTQGRATARKKRLELVHRLQGVTLVRRGERQRLVSDPMGETTDRSANAVRIMISPWLHAGLWDDKASKRAFWYLPTALLRMDLSTRNLGGAGGAAVMLVIAAMPRWRASSLRGQPTVEARCKVATWESEIGGRFASACEAAMEAGAIDQWGVRGKGEDEIGWVRPIPEAVEAGKLGVEAHLWPKVPATVGEIRAWAVSLGGEDFARKLLGEPGDPVPLRTWQRWTEGEPDAPLKDPARSALRELYWSAR